MYSKAYRYRRVQRRLNLLSIIVYCIAVFVVCTNFHYIADFFKFQKWSVSDWIYFIQTLVITISAFIAYKTIQSSKQVSKESATLEIILADNKDTQLIEANSDLLLFLTNPDKFYQEFALKNPKMDEKTTTSFVGDICDQTTTDKLEVKYPDLTSIIRLSKADLTPAQEDIRTKMLTVLSRHEFYAIGLNAGLLDENLFKRMHCSNFISLWEQVSPAVSKLREKEKKDTLFKDFEILALRWKADPLSVEDINRSIK